MGNNIKEQYNAYTKDVENLDLLSALKNEQQLLLGKMKKAMDEDNVGTYKNLVLALKEITGLVQREEWIQQWSRYSSEGKEYVAVWEQKGSEIKNHRKFEIKSENIIENYQKAYVEVDRDSICIYYKGEKTLIKIINNSNAVHIKVKEVLNYNKQIPIYIDVRSSGIVMHDILKSEGYNVIYSTNKNIIIN